MSVTAKAERDHAMGGNIRRKIICALDFSDLDEALGVAKRLAPHIGAFKIGHGLTLTHGLDVISRFQDLGCERIFLDLKFHDIPNSVAIAVREATKRGVWMMTMHISGGPAMMTAAVEEARYYGDDEAPLLIGVSVLTSLNQHVLTDYLGVHRTLNEHMATLSRLAVDCGMDGVVCSPQEVAHLRASIGHGGVIVTPGIRSSSGDRHDQVRVGTAAQAVADGADYLVIGRALVNSPDIEGTLAEFDDPQEQPVS